MKIVSVCVTIWAVLDSSLTSVSTKLDFDEDSITITNSSTVENDDVEVKHTIVVSTSLKNNRKGGLHSSNSDNQGHLTYTRRRKDDDSDEVPIIKGYKAVGSTAIHTPDTRYRAKQYPEAVFINRNIRDEDEYDFYPNVATNPSQWKPSPYYNNINWWGQDSLDSNLVRRIDRPGYENPVKLHRKITDDGIKEFYCKKCAELNGINYRGCPQKGWIQQMETTTQKLKIDGKLAKLN